MRTVPGPSWAARSGHPAQPRTAAVPGRPAGTGRHDELHRHVGQRVGGREGDEGAGVVAARRRSSATVASSWRRLAVGRHQGAARRGGCRSRRRRRSAPRWRRRPSRAGRATGGPRPGRRARPAVPPSCQPASLEAGVGRVDEHQPAHHLRAGAGEPLGEQPAVRVADDDHRVGGRARARQASSTVASRSTSSGRSTTRCHGVEPPIPGRSNEHAAHIGQQVGHRVPEVERQARAPS